MKHSHVPLQRHTLTRSSTYTRVKQTVWEDSGLGTHSENIHATTSYSLCAVLLLSPPPLRCQLKHTLIHLCTKTHALWRLTILNTKCTRPESALLKVLTSQAYPITFTYAVVPFILFECDCVSMRLCIHAVSGFGCVRVGGEPLLIIATP